MSDKSFVQRVDDASSVQYVTPATGDTVTITQAPLKVLAINPSGTIATLTVAFPSAPVDGDEITLTSSQIVTALTISSSKSVILALTALVVGGFAKYKYIATPDKWYRIG